MPSRSRDNVLALSPEAAGSINSSNDIGFARKADGRFEAKISDFDRRQYGNLWLGQLAQRYAYRVARDVLAEQGFDLVEESVSADRQIHLCVRRAA